MLQGRITYPELARPVCAVLLAGAHPLLGGNMTNNVISALRVRLAILGCIALSFEYCKPGDSSPNTWTALLTEFWQTHHVSLESLWQKDARSAARFLRGTNPAPLVLVGYSFGCWAIAEMAATFDPAALILISPNPSDHDLSAASTVAAPLLVVSSDNDFSCTPDQLRIWLDSLRGPHAMCSINGAEHFFRGRETELVDRIAHFLRSNRLIVK